MTKAPLSRSVSISELLHMRNEDHLTNSQIAKRLDVCPATILRYIGPDIRRPDHPNETSRGRRVTTELISKIRDMYIAGGSIAGIAQEAGLSWNTVKKYTSDLPDRKALNKAETLNIIETPAEPAKCETPSNVQPVSSETSVEPAVVQPVQHTEQKGEEPMLQIISRRQTIRMKGTEYEYLLELGAGSDTVTIQNVNGQPATVLDANGLANFMGELGRILRSLKDAEVSA